MEHYAPPPLAHLSTPGIGCPAQYQRHRLYEQRYLTGEPSFRQLLGRKYPCITDPHQLCKHAGWVFYHHRLADTPGEPDPAAYIDRRCRIYQRPERRFCSRVRIGVGDTCADIDDLISYRREWSHVIGRLFLQEQTPRFTRKEFAIVKGELGPTLVINY